MKNIYKKIILVISIIVSPILVSAQTPPKEYTVLAPLPGVPAGPTTLSTYLPAIFNLSIGIAAVLAFAMITFGGIMYATSDAISGKSEGRRYITNAVWGLILVLAAYAILYTINPKILAFDLTLPLPPQAVTPIPIVTGTLNCINTPSMCSRVNGILQGYPLTPEQVALNNTVRDDLATNSPPLGIVVNNGPCTYGQTTGCTNVVGLPSNAIGGLKSLESSCACSVVVTGGTEGGHAAHGPGLAVVDLSPTPNLNSFLARTNPAAVNPTSGLTVPVGGATYTFENTGDNGRATAPHWHVQF